MYHLDALTVDDVIGNLFDFIERESNQNMTIYRLNSVSGQTSNFSRVSLIRMTLMIKKLRQQLQVFAFKPVDKSFLVHLALRTLLAFAGIRCHH